MPRTRGQGPPVSLIAQHPVQASQNMMDVTLSMLSKVLWFHELLKQKFKFTSLLFCVPSCSTGTTSVLFHGALGYSSRLSVRPFQFCSGASWSAFPVPGQHVPDCSLAPYHPDVVDQSYVNFRRKGLTVLVYCPMPSLKTPACSYHALFFSISFLSCYCHACF